jgi:hypothetical protein
MLPQNDIRVSSYTILFIVVICRDGDTKVVAGLTKDEGTNSRIGE